MRRAMLILVSTPMEITHVSIVPVIAIHAKLQVLNVLHASLAQTGFSMERHASAIQTASTRM